MDYSNFGLIRSLISDLNMLIEDTENIYLELGKHFPELIREMETSIRTSKEMIGDLSETGAAAGQASIAATIRKTRTTVQNASEMFEQLHERADKLFDLLDGNIEQLSALEHVIDNIKDDSIEMEIVSINAMTVALKAGNAGRAFSFITDELKRLSGMTITLTDTVARTGDRILQLFRRFKVQMESVRKKQELTFRTFRDRLFESFENFNNGVEELVSVLYTISSNSSEVKKPLIEIMQEVQLQDIIKQSIRHVVIALEEAHATPSENGDTLTDIDAHYFVSMLSELCVQLLDDIEDRIGGSIDGFREKLADAGSVISSVETERKQFTDSASLSQHFDASSRMLKELLRDLRDIMKEKRAISDTSSQLMKEVSALDKSFLSFSTLISRFHNVAVASRIEVAKQSVLQNMRSTVISMTELIDRIENDVEISLKETKSFIEKTSLIVEEYTATLEHEIREVGSFEHEIELEYEELNLTGGSISERISSFSLYTARFIRLLSGSDGKLQELQKLIADIEKIKAGLRAAGKESDQILKQQLDGRDIRGLELKSGKLQEIIQKFTILTHKKAAGEIAGFEVEEGVTAGEITIF